MAIQIPYPGTGNGATGDNEFVLWSKVKDNFSDKTNAASKLVGTASDQIPLAGDVYKAANTHIQSGTVTPSANDFELGTKLYYRNSSVTESMAEVFPSQLMVTETVAMRERTPFIKQYSHLNGETDVMVRALISNRWTEWTALSTNIFTYKTTTASGANVVVTSKGELRRSTAISYTDTNTTKDSNGFIKAASPIVKVFADKVELNGEAVDQDVTYKKNGVGDYAITTVSGLSIDGWYIELPKDMNGNPKVAVTLSEEDGVISLKSYKRIFSTETFTFEPDLDNPLDIPDTRWIDLRLNEIPVEIEDDIQPEEVDLDK